MRPRDRVGFTLVELLVVITIIGILVGLMVPAVNAAREAMRRSTCSNNLHQLALGALAHEAQHKHLPTGGWGRGWAGDASRGYTARQPGGWHFNLLTFIDLEVLRNQPNGERVAKPVATFICPTRRRVEAFPYSSTGSNSYVNLTVTDRVGRSDYAANSGTQPIDSDMAWAGPTKLEEGDPPSSRPPYDWKGKPGGNATGVVFRHSEVNTGSIKDGATYTYLFGERFINPAAYRLCVAPDNDQGWDMGYDCEVNRWGIDQPRQDSAGIVGWAVFGGPHSAGFNMSFCDGSVRRISYGIELETHRRLSNRADGLNVNPGDL